MPAAGFSGAAVRPWDGVKADLASGDRLFVHRGGLDELRLLVHWLLRHDRGGGLRAPFGHSGRHAGVYELRAVEGICAVGFDAAA